MEGVIIMKYKYKLKLDKIYFYKWHIKINYTLYMNNTVIAQGGGISLLDYLIYWYEIKIKHKFNIRF